jgi:hypothetical protein
VQKFFSCCLLYGPCIMYVYFVKLFILSWYSTLKKRLSMVSFCFCNVIFLLLPLPLPLPLPLLLQLPTYGSMELMNMCVCSHVSQQMLFWSPKIDYRVHKNLPLVPTISQMNLILNERLVYTRRYVIIKQWRNYAAIIRKSLDPVFVQHLVFICQWEI